MLLIDDNRLLRNIYALLWANRITQLAAYAASAYIVARCGLRLFTYGNTVTNYMRRIADVKIFALRFIKAENL